MACQDESGYQLKSAACSEVQRTVQVLEPRAQGELLDWTFPGVEEAVQPLRYLRYQDWQS